MRAGAGPQGVGIVDEGAAGEAESTRLGCFIISATARAAISNASSHGNRFMSVSPFIFLGEFRMRDEREQFPYSGGRAQVVMRRKDAR